MARFGKALATLFFVMSGSAVYASHLQTIALTGEAAPEARFEPTFDFFHAPSINIHGKVAFRAETEIGPSGSRGIWLGDASELNLIVEPGDTLPGTIAGTELTFLSNEGPFPLNDAGEIVFGAVARDPLDAFISQSGLWTASKNGYRKIAVQGDVVQHAGTDLTFSRLESFRTTLNAQGDVAFPAFALQDPNDTVVNGAWVFRNSTSTHELLAADGAAVGAAAPGFTYSIASSIPNLRPVINDAGTAAFSARITDGSQSIHALVVSDPNSQSLPVRTGDPAPAAGSGFTFSSGGNPVSINNQDDILIDPDVTDGTDRLFSIWTVNGNSPHLTAIGGEQLPGDDPNLVIGNFFYDPVINAQGKIAAFGSIQQRNGSGRKTAVLSGTAGNIEVIAAEGEPAPGTGEVFGSLIRNTPGMNDIGQVAFTAGIQNLTSTFGSLWATDVEGDLNLIVKEGDVLEVRPNDFREVDRIQFSDRLRNGSGGQDGRARGLNDLGQITFQATFTDGSQGIFVSNLVAVPEPHAIALAVTLLLVLGRTCRMRG